MRRSRHGDAGAVDRARAAIAHGAWDEASTVLHAVWAERPLSAPELGLLGEAAYGAGHLETALEAWEQAHRQLVEAGAAVEAAEAAVTVGMYLMMDTGLMAPVRGWTARADRLLAGRAEGPVHAWLAMVRTYERLMCGDMADADRWARQAVDVGTRHVQPAPVAMGRLAAARVRIFRGEVDEGLALLDEAAVATVSGDLEPLVAGMVYCELVCAMQGLAQYDRAEQWTDAMQRWGQDHAFGGITGRCRVHRAELLRLRGSCAEAETEALRACDELRPWMRREFGWPLTELGTIRLRKGDLAGAEEALLAAHEHGWDPQPSLALLRLAQGDAAGAAALIRDALEHPRKVPSKERPPDIPLTRAPLLDAQVEIAVAAGDVGAATRAAGELDAIAVAYRSRALAAAAALAHGRVALARQETGAAVTACDDAVGIWSEVGAPYEAASARMVLAEAHRRRGSDQRALLELQAARSTFERLGAARKAREAWSACREDVHPTAAATPPAITAATGPAETGGAPGATRGPATASAATFRRDGDMRRIGFAGREIHLRDLKGMRYLARLLAAPGREFHVLDLLTAEQGAVPTRSPAREPALTTPQADLGPVLDDRAVASYKQRLVEVEDDLDEARRLGDTERAALAAADRDYLVGELSQAFGLGGRHRPTGATSERARASVTRAMRYALARVAAHHPTLGTHLDHAVATGTYCAYTPDPTAPITWTV